MARSGVSKNMGRLNGDLKRELIDIVGNMKDPRVGGGMLTITRVEAAPDLSTCKVFVSVMGEDEDATANTVAALNAAKGHVRSEIANRMHIRRSPEFTFVEDGSAAYAAHINDLLKGL